MATKFQQGLVLSICCVGCAGYLAIASRMYAPPPGTSCGPTALYALCQHLGIETNFPSVLQRCGGRYGTTNFMTLKLAAQQLGLHAQGWKMTVTDLKRLKPNGVIHLTNQHFISVLEYCPESIVAADPSSYGSFDLTSVSYSKLSHEWDGYILVISKNNLRFAPKK